MLPVLTYTAPGAAADALRWRHATLPLARSARRSSGSRAPRSRGGPSTARSAPATGPPARRRSTSTPTSPTPSSATSTPPDDDDFERDVGLELLVETARLWRSLGHHDSTASFRIDGVTGPDEYSAIADNNVYTNLMAQRNLRGAADAARAASGRGRPSSASTPRRRPPGGTPPTAMCIPYDEELGVHPQAEGFTAPRARGTSQAPRPDQYPLLLHFPYFDLYRKQVVKQADLVLAMQLRGDAFTPEQKARNFDYYEALTVRDSSLSACTQAVIAAEVGPPRAGATTTSARPR